jgi:hypothetical protein
MRLGKMEIALELAVSPVIRQNSMLTENSAIPCRDRCPIQVIPSTIRPVNEELPLSGGRRFNPHIIKGRLFWNKV